MARGSKKGKLSGLARKEINSDRATDAVDTVLGNIRLAENGMDTMPVDFIFARVTKNLGVNHIEASYDSKRGPQKVRARIPNIFGRRGATPVTDRDVVVIHVGEDFDANKDSLEGVQCDITAILTVKQAFELKQAGVIPPWMIHEEGAAAAATTNEDGFEFDYSELPELGPAEEKVKRAGAALSDHRRKAGGGAGGDDDIDVDNI